MLFRLTFLLVAGLFIVLYFAPELPEGSRAAQSAANRAAPPAAPSVPEAFAPVPETEPAPAPAPAPVVSPEVSPETPAPDTASRDAADAPGPASGDVADSPRFQQAEDTAETPAPLVVEGLSGGDAASALSLSERVRARAEAERERAAADADADAAPTPAEEAPQQTAPRLPGPGEGRAQVVATAVNLRGGPSTATPVVGRVSFGDEVVLLGDAAPGWSRIRHPETGEEAFMASRFLQPLGN